MANKEAIYDEQIASLMKQIIEIAKAHGIDFIATFELGLVPDGEEEERAVAPLHVVTYVNPGNHMRLRFMDYACQAGNNADALIIALMQHARRYGNESSAALQILGIPCGTKGENNGG